MSNHHDRPASSDHPDNVEANVANNFMEPTPLPRRRRAGEDDDAIERAVNVAQRFAGARATLNANGPGVSLDDDIASVFQTLADTVVGPFCRWCVVDLVGPPRRRLLVRDGGEATIDGDADASTVLGRVPGLDEVVERAVLDGRRQRYPAQVTTGLPWCIVAPLSVHDKIVAIVAIVRDSSTPGFGPMEATAIDEIAWGAATTIERLDLRRQTDRAVAVAHRVASHLRALIATSIALQVADERDVATEIVSRARSLFDAESVILVDDGPPRRITRADRDGASYVADEFVPVGDDRSSERADDRWLIATVRDASGNPRGRLAILRSAPGPDEDEEIATLLAQSAGTALSASELSRVVRTSEARWRALVDSAPIGLVEVETDERVRWWNRAAASILSWPIELDPDAAPMLTTDLLVALRGVWREALTGAVPRATELRDVAVAGRPRDLIVSARLLESHDETPATLLTLVDDVTDRRQMREELRHAHTMEIRGLVAGSTVHDFNNLLTVIAGYGELLVDELDEGPARDAATAIVATSARASALAGQLQTIGRTQRPDLVAVNPADVVESNLEVIERILGETITLRWVSPRDALFVHADADQFEQVLLNLIINARDAMANGGELRLDLEGVRGDELDERHRVDRSLAYARLRVSDTGHGMDDETMRRCFDAHFTTKGPFNGTGLGLAAARRFSDESGGSIEVRSRVGVGSTFEVVLPITDSPTAKVERIERSSPASAPRAATILVVEDDEALRHLVVRVLRRNGHHVLDAPSAEAAIELLDDSIELVLSDVVLGGLSGVDLARRVGEVVPAAAVLLTSGSADRSVLDDLALGASDFIAKPFRPSQLVERVYALLARRGR